MFRVVKKLEEERKRPGPGSYIKSESLNQTGQRILSNNHKFANAPNATFSTANRFG